MKFAKEIEQDLVPEWRAKYFDYKTGKKKVKTVARALKNVSQSPKTPGRQLPSNLLNNALQSPIRNHASQQDTSAQSTPDNRVSALTSYGSAKPTLQGGRSSQGYGSDRESHDGEEGASPLSIPGRKPTMDTVNESDSLWGSGAITNYGSIVASPPVNPPPMGPPSLELPDPALSPTEEQFPRHNRAWRHSRFNPNPHTTPPLTRVNPSNGESHEAGESRSPAIARLLPKHRNGFHSRRSISTPGPNSAPTRPSRLRRMFSAAAHESPRGDVPLEAYKDLDIRKAEYNAFLDRELFKIESFYKMKETEASDRLQILRSQLHEMRDRRLEDLRFEKTEQERERREHARAQSNEGMGNENGGHHRSASAPSKWRHPIENAFGSRGSRIGKVTKSLQQWGSPSGPHPQGSSGTNRPESWRDFTRRPTHIDDVPYRSAKRKLKLALQEFYRGLELLKSYALLNRTAFRKINKKYDKATHSRPAGRYMSEKVNKAWFVQSEVLDSQIVAVEDLYARYFERGNHKVAAGKLRSKTTKAADYSGSIFRNGLLLAAGMVFGIQGIVYGAEKLNSHDIAVVTGTSYLMQIYAGYFLALFLFLIFCIDCKIWSKAKINYVFIFEFDNRHNLDWHQLSELPCLCLFLLGLFMWLNFQSSSIHYMYLKWPAILVGLTLLILFIPAPIFYHRSREWWAYSNFRLLLAGLYPVEFRDFFLGDMYCSQTYAMGNVELFFCLYANDWNNPGQCNSTHSRLLGFFSTLPGIWRALQCLRRYYDTRNAFPHLVNCGKYTFTILFYMTLSLYRIDKTDALRALFITCATVNSTYCSVWDVAMDWSLCNPYAPHPFLRETLGYKRPGVYYAAIVTDVILRFNWIFYALFTGELQHSALLSFFVGFSEICRRGIWTLFRVENEHCTNVGRFRASRDVPLPYEIEPPPSPAEGEVAGVPSSSPQTATIDHYIRHRDTWQGGNGTGSMHDDGGISTNIEAQTSSTPGSLRRRATLTNTPIQRGIARVGTIMGQAHAQDFERKRRPVAPEPASPYHGARTADLSSDDEDEEVEVDLGAPAMHDGDEDGSDEEGDRGRQEDEEDVQSAQEILRRHRSATAQ